jgi:hypothetical protein
MRNDAILLRRAMALHSKNLAKFEMARGLFVTICSATLHSEKVRKMAKRTKSGMTKDKRC